MFAGSSPLGAHFGGGETLAAAQLPHAWPQLAGLKFRSINLAHRTTDSGNDDNVPTPVPAFFYDLIRDIGVNGDTETGWTQWLRPQIDLMKSLGANCARIIFDPTVRVGDADHNGPATWTVSLTEAQFASAFRLIAGYLAEQGMYFYPCAMEPYAADNLTDDQILAYTSEFVALASASDLHNVVAIDVMQEFHRSTWAMTGDNLQTLTDAAREALVKPLPITHSCFATTGAAIGTTVSTYVPMAYRVGVDFLDIHVYLYADAGLFMDRLSPNNFRLPIIIGETGVGYNGGYFEDSTAQETTHPFSSERRARHYQDFIASAGHRHDLQMVEAWCSVREWDGGDQDSQDWGLYDLTQDENYVFTTPRPEMVGPYQTIETAPQAYNRSRTLDLTGDDTTIDTWSALSTYMLGWGLHDYSNTFSRDTQRVKRATDDFGIGAVNYFDIPALDQSISVDFDSSEATAADSHCNWSVSVRHQGTTSDDVNEDTYYLANIISKPGTPSEDGVLTLFAVVNGSPTLLAESDATSLGLTKNYRLSLSASGQFPTTLVATVTDLDTDSVFATLTHTDSTFLLQFRGSLGLPANTGTVYYTNVVLTSTNDAGPSLSAPTLTPASSTSLDVSWTAASGGVGSVLYTTQYVALDEDGFPVGDWTSLPMQAGTTATITGLTAGTTYAVRVQAVDNSFLRVPRYSPWGSAAATGGFQAAWARGSNVLIGAGL